MLRLYVALSLGTAWALPPSGPPNLPPEPKPHLSLSVSSVVVHRNDTASVMVNVTGLTKDDLLVSNLPPHVTGKLVQVDGQHVRLDLAAGSNAFTYYAEGITTIISADGINAKLNV